MDDMPRYARPRTAPRSGRSVSPGLASRRALRAAAATAVVAFGGLIAPALSRAASTFTLKAAENFVVFNQHVQLTGTADTKHVTLLARHFGETQYEKVATATVRDGQFHFSPVPILATRYEVASGAATGAHSRSVQVYVHLDAGPITCALCRVVAPSGPQQLRLSYTVRAPLAALTYILAEPVYVYVGTSAEGKVQSVKRVGTVTPHRLGHGAFRLSASVPIDIPVGGKFRYVLCDRANEPHTGVGLPSVHDCGEPTLSHAQFKRYVG